MKRRHKRAKLRVRKLTTKHPTHFTRSGLPMTEEQWERRTEMGKRYPLIAYDLVEGMNISTRWVGTDDPFETVLTEGEYVQRIGWSNIGEATSGHAVLVACARIGDSIPEFDRAPDEPVTLDMFELVDFAARQHGYGKKRKLKP